MTDLTEAEIAECEHWIEQAELGYYAPRFARIFAAARASLSVALPSDPGELELLREAYKELRDQFDRWVMDAAKAGIEADSDPDSAGGECDHAWQRIPQPAFLCPKCWSIRMDGTVTIRHPAPPPTPTRGDAIGVKNKWPLTEEDADTIGEWMTGSKSIPPSWWKRAANNLRKAFIENDIPLGPLSPQPDAIGEDVAGVIEEAKQVQSRLYANPDHWDLGTYAAIFIGRAADLLEKLSKRLQKTIDELYMVCDNNEYWRELAVERAKPAPADVEGLAEQANRIAAKMEWEAEPLNRFGTGYPGETFIPFAKWYRDVAAALTAIGRERDAAFDKGRESAFEEIGNYALIRRECEEAKAALTEQNRKLIEALQFYANGWEGLNMAGVPTPKDELLTDMGSRAIAALKGEGQ